MSHSQFSLRIGTTAESPLEASKWLEIQALIDEVELADLFNSLPHFHLYFCGAVLQRDAGAIALDDFILSYKDYIETLRNGTIPNISYYRKALSPAMTTDPDALYRVMVGEDKEIIRQARPVVQLQANTISYSQQDKKFHTMAFGTDNIAWGIQFSYPQLYRDPVTKLVEQVRETPAFPNTPLFHSLQKWMRKNTTPTPFIANGELTNSPIRLGKRCYEWIDKHPQLLAKGISIKPVERQA